MTSKRVFFLMLGLLAILLIGLGGGAYGVNNLLQARSDKLVNLKTKSQVLDQQKKELIVAKKQVKQYAGLEQIAKSIVPQDKDQAEAVLEIAKIASASGISQLSSVTFPASTLGGTKAATPGATAPKTTVKSPLTQLTPVIGMKGVYQLQINITQSADNQVSYNQFLTFLSKLEQNRRTAQVSSLTLLPDSKNPNMVSFSLVINEFIKP